MLTSDTFSIKFVFADNEHWRIAENHELATGLTATEIFSPSGGLIGSYEGQFKLALSKGIYRARVKKYGQSKDTLFVVNGDVKTPIELETPRRHSSVPISDSVGFHEYYRSHFIDKSYTCKSLADDDKLSNLSIFIRMKDKTEAQRLGEQDLFSGLRLTDQAGKLLTEFTEEEIAFNYHYGSARFRAQIAPGYYRLYSVWNGRAQWMPIHVFCHRDCDISMLWNEKPLFSTMSMFYPYSDCDENSLNAHEFEQQAQSIDAVMQTLSSGYRNTNISSALVRYLLNQKFNDPMLGIMGLYLVLLGKTAESSNVGQIINRLRNLLPDSPDIEALHYIAWEQGLVEDKAWRFKDIPMVRLGAKAMQRALNTQTGIDKMLGVSPPLAPAFFIGFTNYSVWAQSQMEKGHAPWVEYNTVAWATLRWEEPKWLIGEVVNAMRKNKQQTQEAMVLELATRFQVLLPTIEAIVNNLQPPLPPEETLFEVL